MQYDRSVVLFAEGVALAALVINLVALRYPNHGRALSSQALFFGLVDAARASGAPFEPHHRVAVFVSAIAAVIANCAAMFDTCDSVLGPNALYLTYASFLLTCAAFCIYGTWALDEGDDEEEDDEKKRAVASAPAPGNESWRDTATLVIWIAVPCLAALGCALSDAFDAADAPPIAAAFALARYRFHWLATCLALGVAAWNAWAAWTALPSTSETSDACSDKSPPNPYPLLLVGAVLMQLLGTCLLQATSSGSSSSTSSSTTPLGRTARFCSAATRCFGKSRRS
jgi:hypothetical protein